MKRNYKRNEAILTLHKDGLSSQKIAELFPPITRQRVWQIVQQEKTRLSTPKR